MTSVRKVPFEEIEFDSRCQARAALTSDAIEEYAEAYRSKVEMPPVEVFDVDGRLYLVDGFHRIEAMRRAGVSFVKVVVVGKGSIGDASWYSTGVNWPHGVRRSDADKRRAVRNALDGIGQEQSNRAIAQHIKVSDTFVAKVRTEWEAEQVRPSAPDEASDDDGDEVRSAAPEPERKRRGKDGKLYPAKPRDDRLAGDPEVPSRPEPPVTDAAPLPFEPEDRPGQKVPGYGPALLEAAKRVREARLFALRSVPEAIELNGMRQRFEQSMRQAQTALEMAEPVACPKCSSEGCAYCGSAGWVQRQAVAR